MLGPESFRSFLKSENSTPISVSVQLTGFGPYPLSHRVIAIFTRARFLAFVVARKMLLSLFHVFGRKNLDSPGSLPNDWRSRNYPFANPSLNGLRRNAAPKSLAASVIVGRSFPFMRIMLADPNPF